MYLHMTVDISHMKFNICYIHTCIKAIDVTHKAIYRNYMYTSLHIRRFRFITYMKNIL